MTVRIRTDEPPRWLTEKFLPIASRIFVWALIFTILYLLRSFFLLIFLTFVFAYIQSHATDGLATKIANRSIRVVLVAITFLSVIVAIGAFIVPHIKEQAEVFTSRYSLYIQKVDHELVNLSQEYPVLDRLIPSLSEMRSTNGGGSWNIEHSPTASLIQRSFGVTESGIDEAEIHETFKALRNVGGSLLAVASAFLLALLFSFLIVLDLPHLAAGVRSLANTKIGFIYNEVSSNIYNLGRVVGRALEAQLFIAMLNMVLTAIGIYALGIRENLIFISVIVFLCSFIPVAGVFISSAPICLMALQQGGPALMLLTALLIWIIHLIEAYVLNPKIYGHHLHINAVLVLIILTIAGKLFGLWGLVLGLPVSRYIFGHAIQYKRTDTV